jgi:hypothetical protein
MKNVLIALATSVVLVALPAWSQDMPEFLLRDPGTMGEGWQGFADVGFLVGALLPMSASWSAHY